MYSNSSNYLSIFPFLLGEGYLNRLIKTYILHWVRVSVFGSFPGNTEPIATDTEKTPEGLMNVTLCFKIKTNNFHPGLFLKNATPRNEKPWALKSWGFHFLDPLPANRNQIWITFLRIQNSDWVLFIGTEPRYAAGFPRTEPTAGCGFHETRNPQQFSPKRQHNGLWTHHRALK